MAQNPILLTILACLGAFVVILMQFRKRAIEREFHKNPHKFRIVTRERAIVRSYDGESETAKNSDAGLSRDLSRRIGKPRRYRDVEVANSEPLKKAPVAVTVLMQVIISLMVLIAALYVIVVLKDAETSLKDWSYGAIGTILGFWLKG